MSTPAISDAVTSALQSWSQGQQQAALDVLRPHADAGERSAVMLISWFFSQMGQPFWSDGLVYARRAVEMGMPQVAQYFYGNLINDTSFRNQLPDLIREAIAAGWPIDPMPNVPGVLQQGDPSTAIGLVDAASTPRPYPGAWESILKQAEADLAALTAASSDVQQRREAVLDVMASNEAAVQEQRTVVERQAQSLLGLIERLTSAQATSYFDEEATSYEGEARRLWRGGLGVLIAAAVVALAPIAIYYVHRAIGRTPWLSGNELVGAHAAAAIALGAVAGVLLARARGRDRARQRNRQLSVALQTMFVYSEQIADQDERQTFIRDMGRTVLDAFLRHDSHVDSDRSIVGAMRT